jgi:hypothetical protein
MVCARPAVRTLLIVIALALPGACSAPADLQNALELADTSSGWYDAGIVDGKNKIVPSVSFRLRKKGDVDLSRVSLNVVFRHPPAPGTDSPEDWDEVFIQNAEFTEGHQTPILTVRTPKGYTGDPPQTRLDLMKNSFFRDVRAHIYVKHSSTQWVEVGTIDVQRQLLTR